MLRDYYDGKAAKIQAWWRGILCRKTVNFASRKAYLEQLKLINHEMKMKLEVCRLLRLIFTTRNGKKTFIFTGFQPDSTGRYGERVLGRIPEMDCVYAVQAASLA